MPVKCELCGKEFKCINGSHLKKCGNMTVFEYKVKFPNSEITSIEIKEYCINKSKEYWNDKNHRIIAGKLSKEFWKDPKNRKEKSNQNKELWKDLNYRKNQSKCLKNRWKDPEYCKKMSEYSKEFWKDPENRTKHSKLMKDLWVNDKKFIKKVLDKMQDPKNREHLRQKTTEYFSNPKHREAASDRTSETYIIGKLQPHKYYKYGSFFSIKNNKQIFYRSSYEKIYYKYLENNNMVISYVVEPIKIKYLNHKGLKRNYIPDVLVEYNNSIKELTEIKPECFLKNEITILKIKALKKYCKENNLIPKIITEKELNDLK